MEDLNQWLAEQERAMHLWRREALSGDLSDGQLIEQLDAHITWLAGVRAQVSPDLRIQEIHT
jgi:hypothetical protein